MQLDYHTTRAEEASAVVQEVVAFDRRPVCLAAVVVPGNYSAEPEVVAELLADLAQTGSLAAAYRASHPQEYSLVSAH